MHINCLGKLIDLNQPKVMGILNITPDSFYDGGFHLQEIKWMNQVEKMLTEGAHFIDIGACSSKPGAQFVSEIEEIQRLTPVLKGVLKNFPQALISVDTFRSEVAKQAISSGAALINDISAGHLDHKMFETIAELKVPYIMMHLRGTSTTMMQLTDYEDVVKEVLLYFSERVSLARRYGIHDLIIDPGFGFAKNQEQNYEVFAKLELFHTLELPILVGISRKSMIYKPLQSTPSEALNGTTILNALALQKGAQLLRVHDVKEAIECIKIHQLIHKSYENI
jgi:dihydropteroate synthase